MNSLIELLAVRISKAEMIQFVQSTSTNFQGAVELAHSGKNPIGWRAAWILGHCIKKNDPRIQPHIDQLMKALPYSQDGHQRELLKILMKMALDEDQEGLLFDHCMSIWEKPGKSPSVRIFAFQFIVQTVQKYPDLRHEIEFILQDHYSETLSPGIRKSFERLKQKIC